MVKRGRHAYDTQLFCEGIVLAQALRYGDCLRFLSRIDDMNVVSAWLRIPFWQRVVGGFVLGALAGWALGPAA